jgi:hypothetical protein
MHVLINLSWKCQLKCPYCLLPHIQINREAVEHSWQEWVIGITNNVTRGSIVDVAGGDPLLFPGLAYFLRGISSYGIHWAITTNALGEEGLEEILRVRPGGCVLVNVSDHPGNKFADANIERLREVYPVTINRVDHPQAGKRQVEIGNLIPYQSYREGTELDGIRRMCNAGINHWVADPGGDVFQCNVAMATGRKPIGNLFLGGIRTPSQPYVCDWGCSSCYTSVPGAWQEMMRAL